MKGSTLRSVKKDESPSIPVEKEATGVRGVTGSREVTLPAVFDRMERLMDDMFHGELRSRFGGQWDRLMREFGFGGEGGVRVDLFEEKDTLVVKADLPGVTKDDLSVRVIEGNLMISGERRHEEKVERKDYLRIERNFGTFSRIIPLPEGVNADGITATLKEGILEVRVPRIEVKKPVVLIKIS
jgi:HSP20 family protein